MIYRLPSVKFGFGFGFCLFFMFGQCYSALPNAKSKNHSRVEFATVIARLVTTLGASLQETPSKKWNIAADVSRELNTLTGNYVYSRKNNKTISQALSLAQLCYVGNVITALVAKPQEIAKRTRANRALLVTLALIESGAMFGVCCSAKNANWFADIAALTSVIHSIASTQDKYSKMVDVAALILMLEALSEKYCVPVAKKLNKIEEPEGD